MAPPPRGGSAESAVQALVTPLERLDARLLAALGEQAAPDRESPEAPPPGSALHWLAGAYELSAFDLDVIVLAVAPELDRRYEQVYARLAGDGRARRPTVDVVLRVLCDSALERLEQRARLGPGAPLVRHGLVRLAADPDVVEATLPARQIAPDPQVLALLLDEPGIDARLAPSCDLVVPSPHDDPAEAHEAEIAAMLTAEPIHDQLHVLLRCREPAAGRRIAERVAEAAGQPLLAVDCRALSDAATLAVALREARFHGALALLEHADALWPAGEPQPAPVTVAALRAQPAVTILCAAAAPEAGSWAQVLPAALSVELAPLDAEARRDAWRAALTASDLALDDAELDALATRFRLGRSAIENAVAVVARESRQQAQQPGATELFAAARGQAGQELGRLARRVELVYGFDDLVLPPGPLDQLREVLDHVVHRVRVYEDWGFARKHPRSAGLAVLFAGPPGTGKSMAAAVIARELALDLYRIDLSSVVSKYIGETERNLDRVFAAAEDSNAILFFDEADALFGRRTEIRDAHDRYANMEVSYLLQRIEDYHGVVILASNLRNNIDQAFARRMRFTIEFPMPGEAERRRIWEQVWPEQLPRDPDLDLAALAARFDLSGSGIRDAVVGAAFLAAADGGHVTFEHLLHAIRREYESSRRVIPDGAFDLRS